MERLTRRLMIWIVLLLGVVAFSSAELASADIGFSQTIFDSSQVAYERAIGDVDRDGHLDIIATPNESVGELRLYRAPAFQREVVLSLITGVHGYPYFRADDLKLADLDLDGDLDIVVRIGDAGDVNGKVVWIENPLSSCNDVSGTWVVHDIGTSLYIKDIVVADFDADGRSDIAAREPTATHIWFNDGPNTWLKRTTAHPAHEGMDVGDLDGDGDPDLAFNGFWLETPADPRQQTYLQHTIHTKWYNQNVGWQSNSCKVIIADVDGNGTNDVVLSHSEYTGYPVAWYSATNPVNGPWTEHVIVSVCNMCHNLQVADFDRDGALDVLYGGMPDSAQSGLTLMLGDGGTGWTAFPIQSAGSYSAELGDIDEDDDPDIITIRNWDSVPGEIWRNTLREPTPPFGVAQWARIAVDTTRVRWNATLAYFGLGWGDINRDGLLDIVSGRYFYRNPGGSMATTPWPRVDFNVGVNLDASLVVDVDGDAFGDVMASAGPQIYWLEANNTTGTAWTKYLIDNDAPYEAEHTIPQGYAVADIVPGGRPEVLFNNGSAVYAYQIPSSNPTAGNWPMAVLVDQTSSEDIGIGDIDHDGLLDVAVAHWTGSGNVRMKWAHNPGDGSGNWVEYLIGEIIPAGASRYADRVKVADLNGDGRADIVCTEETLLQPASIYWFEAPIDPTAGSWTRHTVATQYTTNSMDVADIDHDGDTDIITQEHRGTRKLQIWENDGCGLLTEHVVDTGIEGHLGARVADLDQDGDLEIFSIAFDAYQNLHLWRNDNGPGVEPIEEPLAARMRINISLPGAAPAAITFDATSSSGAITQYAWSFGDGGTATGPVVTHTYTANGVRTATLTITDTPGGSSVDTAVVYIGSPTQGLIGSWSFEETTGSTAFDQSSQGNNITLQQGATRGVGVFGKALALDGVNDYASRADTALSGAYPAKSDGSGTDGTFAAWIYLDALNLRQPIVQKQGDEQRGINFEVAEDNRLECELFRNQTVVTQLASASDLSANTWYHVALTYDYVANGSSVARLYIDGIADASSDTAVGPIVANTADLNVGRYPWSSAYLRYFDGRIDEIRTFARALTPPEIAALAVPPPDGDADHSGVVDHADAEAMTTCLSGPMDNAWEDCRQAFDFDSDADVDLWDAAHLQHIFGTTVP